MMGVPIDGYCHTCVDNMSVVNNTSIPESVLKKKANRIAYHYVRSKCAEDVLRITYENTKTNLADILTNVPNAPTSIHDRMVISFLTFHTYFPTIITPKLSHTKRECQRYLWSYNTFRCVMSSLSTFRCLTPDVHPRVSYILSSYFR